MKNQFIKKSWIVALALFAAAGCSKNDNPSPEEVEPNPEASLEGQFLVATGSGTATYLLPTAALDDANASISPVGTGLEFNDTFTQYISYGYNGFVAVKYGQGNAHIGQRFTINSTGAAALVGAQFELQNGFITAGLVGDMTYTLMSGNRSSDPTLATLNRIPLSDGTPQFAFLPTNSFAGYEGKNAALLGIVDAGDGSSFYTGLHFWEDNDIDDVAIAKINATSLQVEAVYSDSRLSVSGGFFRSARYSQIGRADNGDIYVFSGNNYGTKKAGALVIKSGAAGFDQDYFWDLETASGGYRFRKVWHVKDDIFLVEFYNEIVDAGASASGNATQYALLNMADKRFSWISGLPDKSNIAESGVKWPYVFNDKIYIGVATTLEDPRFYVVDPESAAATKGLLVNGVTSIESATFVEKK